MSPAAGGHRGHGAGVPQPPGGAADAAAPAGEPGQPHGQRAAPSERGVGEAERRGGPRPAPVSPGRPSQVVRTKEWSMRSDYLFILLLMTFYLLTY